MARKRLQIDFNLVEELASIGCTDREIATICKISEQTLRRRAREALDRGRANLHMSLRRKQIALALKGDRALLIWLGKQYLGQRDRQDVAHFGEPPRIIEEIIESPVDEAAG